MSNAIWRPAPTESVRRAWEAKGGRWMMRQGDRVPHYPPIQWPVDVCNEVFTFYGDPAVALWLPVSLPDWQYDPRGWGDVASEGLKPCPFCGGEAILDAGGRESEGVFRAAYWVRCRSCAAEGPWFRTEGAASERWNERTP